jgi:hypothetical protein
MSHTHRKNSCTQQARAKTGQRGTPIQNNNPEAFKASARDVRLRV